MLNFKKIKSFSFDIFYHFLCFFFSVLEDFNSIAQAKISLWYAVFASLVTYT